MRKAFFAFCFVAVVVILAATCKKSETASSPAGLASVASEIDEARVSGLVGVSIKIVKAQSIGHSPINRFYWISVPGKPEIPKLLEISKACLDEVIAAKPGVFHSFTFHFMSPEDIRPGAASQDCFAKATFLPDGDWQKVGRVPIDGYKGYKLACSFNNPR